MLGGGLGLLSKRAGPRSSETQICTERLLDVGCLLFEVDCKALGRLSNEKDTWMSEWVKTPGGLKSPGA